MPGKKQLYWEDIQVGSEVTPLAKVASLQMLIKWAGAVGDFVPLHYDDHYAAARGFARAIVHGPLKRAWLVHLLTDWIGEGGWLRRFSCEFRVMDYPRLMKSRSEPEEGETFWCKGKVVRKYIEAKEHLVDCEILIERDGGQVTTRGSATVILPSRVEKNSPKYFPHE